MPNESDSVPGTADSVVEVWRGPIVESRHRGHIAAVTGEGKMVAALGAPETVTFLRSSGKPFQALPLVVAAIRDIVEECNNRDPKFKANFAKWIAAEFQVDSPAHLFQGAQHKAVMSKLAEKMSALGIK